MINKSLIYLVSFFMIFCLKAHAQSKPIKALVLTERGDQHEGFVLVALDWLEKFSEENKMDYLVLNHAKDIDSLDLKDFDLIIQLNYPPYTWSKVGEKAFEKYIDEGQGGWIGFHHATLLGEFDGYPMWPWFSDFMGGIRFKNYIAEKATGTVHLEETSHPVFKGIPESFDLPDDEWYVFDRNPRENVHVLANVDENSYRPDSDIKMGDHPVIWENKSKKARNVYFLFGHDAKLLDVEEFKKMFANAIFWASEN